ncbi:gliding motility-associated C-terminal domain-containing protein [Terrimonas sp. NA20]|uniref:Gliding motility-associated C-terminal domain-containing protein n=1 Tax=Terrimonas ginsenosidimutans TaxID=2908004 RepID=A0ABS9KVW7_9BACT|nr:gliding motility-associated C-terminal domain-containing protein [Terrimonas ginsenosidimutans]MCG2616412.1 gliding motility-associated C-terminal domain-containing protein [Terrimonas ginsenosidimutans]
MRHIFSRLLFIWSFSFCCCVSLYAQENFTGINDSVINLGCSQSCASLKFQVPHLKSSDEYTLTSIPFRPYAFTTPTGNALNLDKDDRFTDVINLPFPICFYGAASYDKILVGSNGILTFDISNATCFNAYKIDLPIPSAGTGDQCAEGTVPEQLSYYPRASIMGAYVDLDPAQKISGQRIEWRLEGTAPFRRFVASYNNMAVYGNANCSQTNPTTFQIVVNEGTSVIEVFIARRTCAPGAGSTRNAIIGIQNWDRDKAVTVPGRNATEWTAEKEAYRFIPSGVTSRFVRSELLDYSGNLLETATASEVTPGLMDIQFPNKCFNNPSEKFIVRTTYSGECGSPTPIVVMDTITVNTGTIPLAFTATNSGCAVGSGSIKATITPISGVTGPYIYTINPGAISISSNNTEETFSNLEPGHYSLTVTSANGCSNNVPDIEILTTNTFDVTHSVNPPSCLGAQNASITLTPPAGGGPYTYTINGSPRPTNVITGLPASGPYQINITAGAGCSASVIVPMIPQGSGALTGTATGTSTTCAGLSNGSIAVTATSGSGPYQYSIDNTNWQPSNVFTNLAPGNYSVLIKEGPCTSAAIPVTVNTGSGLNITGTATPASCQGVNNGTVTIQLLNGTAPFTVYLNPSTVLTATGSSVVFNNVAAGSYNVMVTDANGCSTNAPGFTVNVGVGGGFTASSLITNVSCFNGADGSIVITPAGGSSPYSFTLNAGVPQTGANAYIYNDLAANTYSVFIRDAVGCTFDLNGLQLTQPAVLAIPAPVVKAPLCSGANDGEVVISPTGGTAPFTYSLNGGAFQAANTFKVAAGNYTVTVSDAKNCTATLNNIMVSDPPPVSAAIATVSNATCEGGADGAIEITASGGSAGYQYSSDGMNFQTSSILRVKQGTYTVFVKDMNGCSISITNVVVGLTNTLTYTPQTDPAPICEGTGVTLQVVSNATSYTWSSNQSSVIGSPSASATSVQPRVNTLFTVNLQLGVCTAQDDVAVQVLPAPVANAGDDIEICFGQDSRLQASGGISYEWSPPRFLSDPTVASPQVIQPDRTMTYALMVTDANQCRSLDPDQVTVKVIPPIEVDIFPADTVVYAGAQFQYRISSIATSYSWTPATGLSNPNIANPVMTAPANDGATVQFRVEASTDAGCKGLGTATVRVYKGPDIYVANAFSPNNDGKNDVFLPIPVGIKELGYFRVFNRWGQLMFYSKTLREGWDGRFAGLEQPTGVYTWMIEATTQDGRKIAKKGTVTLIR